MMASTRALLILTSLGVAGCMARPERLTLPPDPPVDYPDAEFSYSARRDAAEVDALTSPARDDAQMPAQDAEPGLDAGPAIDAMPGADAMPGPDLPPEADGGVPTYWRDVYPIVVQRCAYCHAAAEADRLAGIPPIVTYAHTRAASAFVGQTIAERMAARVLNSQGGAGDMPQRGSPFANTMTLADRRTVVRWVNAGAPEGDVPDGGVAFPDASVPDSGGGSPLPWANGAPSSDAGTPGVRYVDVYANQGDHVTPHRVPGRATAYSCFVFTIPPNGAATDEYAIEFTPVLDQRRHVHHIEIYRQDPANPRDPVGNGGPEEWHLNTWWNCEGRASQEQLVANFVPGQPSPIRLPTGTGYRFQPGDRLMMEIHYDSVPPGGVTDMTGFRITTTTTQAALVNVGEFWVGPLWNYDVAPTTNNFMGRRVSISSECTITQTVNVFWVRPHMHARGVRQRFWIRRAGSPVRTMLAEVDPWDAGNQPLFELYGADRVFQVGDVVGTSCEFVTEGRDLRWGSGGRDEMCFMDMIHYPYTFVQNSCFTYCDADPSRCPVEYPP